MASRKGRGRKAFSRFSKATRSQKSPLSKKPQPKLESTSQTYGQLILKVGSTQGIASAASVHTKAAKGARMSAQVMADGVIKKSSKKGQPLNVTPPANPTNSNLLQTVSFPYIVPQDTVVNVVQRVDDVANEVADFAKRSSDNNLEQAIGQFSAISSFPSKVKSNIAIVAAASGKEATAVLPPNKIKERSIFTQETPENNVIGALVGNFSKVTKNIIEKAIVVGSNLKSKEQIKISLFEASKVDLSIALKSKESESIDFNCLKTPDLDLDFEYNFFTETEEDIVEEEDPAKDPLLEERAIDVPRYIELRWNMTQVTEPLTNSEQMNQKEDPSIKQLKSEAFKKRRGVTGFSKFLPQAEIVRSKKRVKPLMRDGFSVELPELHDPERVFNSISNHKVFPNSVPTVINVETQKSVVSTLPLIKITK